MRTYEIAETGQATTNAFPVETEPIKTISDFKDLMKAKIPDTFNGVNAKDLTLWRISIHSHPIAFGLSPSSQSEFLSVSAIAESSTLPP
ncbi:MAG: hypothetical protein JOS17DRAFT_791168 [Linnemannia elongata]|nr:MAG: hypothetical protein JOS17DRAFT_791168 [Linnemannia elongata]